MKHESIILGCNIVGHDTTFAFLKNDTLKYVLEEERFNRFKHNFSYTTNGLNYGLEKLNLKIDAIDYVANFMDYDLLHTQSKVFDLECPTDELSDNILMFKSYLYQYKYQLESLFAKDKIINVRHHLAHCAGAYYPSDFEEAAILCIDGRGELETTTIAYGEREKINICKNIEYPHSLGHFYDAITYWLGWGYGEEGKTMALASYGRPLYCDLIFDKLMTVDPSGTFYMKLPFWCEKRFSTISDIFGARRSREEPISQYHKDVAASAQKIVEDIVIKLALTAKELTHSKNLILTGGVALNSVANGKIVANKIFDTVRVYPHANDTGAAIGSAYYVYYNIINAKREQTRIQNNAYLGAEIDIKNVEPLAKKYQLDFETSDNVAKDVATLLFQDLVIGWVQGRAEIGPRALGNRSILANPLCQNAKDKVNKKVKFREAWRPFAPSVLEEDCETYFEFSPPLPYMTIVAPVKKEWFETLHSIMHVDGTARVQTVNKRQNMLYYELIRQFKELSGVGMLLDTSLNINKEPIIQTAEQAIKDFLRTEMDVLVIGNYIFKHKPKTITVESFSILDENIQLRLQKRFLNIYNLYNIETRELTQKLDAHGISYEFTNDIKTIEGDILILLSNSFEYYAGFVDKSAIRELLQSIICPNMNQICFLDSNGLIARYEEIKFLKNYVKAVD